MMRPRRAVGELILNNRRSIGITAASLMVGICLTWPLQSIGLKVTAAFAPPVLQIEIRSGIAAVCVLAIIWFPGKALDRKTALGALAGLLFAIKFFIIGEAHERTPDSHVVVLLYTAPIFAALGLQWKLPSERLAAVQWFEISVAFSGIAFAFLTGQVGGKILGNLGSRVLGDGLAIMVGALWGCTTLLIRATSLSFVPATHILFSSFRLQQPC